MIKQYTKFILEHKFWGKSIDEFLNWVKDKSNKHWVLVDTETVGLPSDPYEIQLTQVSCIIVKYNFDSNTFEEVDTFNKKIKLTDNTLKLMKEPGNRIKNVLSFNHYGQKTDFHEEKDTLQEFFDFIKPYDNPVLVIQNAEFDMRYLNTRGNIKFDNEVLDTKQVAQLFYLPTLQKLAETDPKFADKIKQIGTSSRDSGLISSSLSKIGPALGINMSGYHDALTDCRLMQQMFSGMIELLKQNKGLDISKYQGQRINVTK